MGLGLGAEVVVGYAALVEFIPPDRAADAGAPGRRCFLNTAVFASAVVSYFVLPSIGWRWLFVGVGCCAMAIWYLRKSIPESPRWLESKGRFQEAEAIVAMVEKQAGVALPPPAAAPPPQVQVERSLFARELWGRLAVGFALNIGINVAVYGFIVWLPTFFVKQGMTITGLARLYDDHVAWAGRPAPCSASCLPIASIANG